MGEERAEGRPKPRVQYKKPMGCFARMLIAIVIIAVILLVVMVIHFQFILKKSKPDITLKEYFSLQWEATKDRVAEYKEKALEWKDWLEKSEKTKDWLDKMFPARKIGEKEDETAASAGEKPETRPEEGEKPPQDTPETGEQSGEAEAAGESPQPEVEPGIHPEFQAAADEFRAGLVHFQNRENNLAFERFRKAQDHLEKYRTINPDDPQIGKFEEELAPFLHASMKDSKVR